ncbi:MAG: hypothetical protein V4713_12255 [Pseudomonadota bacterium]
MILNGKEVFLVSGQLRETKVGGRKGVSPRVEQRVVIAKDDLAAYNCLSAQEPDFSPLGHATLDDYEETARKVRAVVEGNSDVWKLYTQSPA